MKILSKQTSLFTEETSTFLQEVSHANLTAKQVKDLEKRMTDTSGQKCLEQYKKLSQSTLWGKMFLELLVGMKGWYSTKCRLTWKMKGTKYNRLYFQLYPSTHHTEGIGSGLLPTPLAQEGPGGSAMKLSDAVDIAIGRNPKYYTPTKRDIQKLKGLLPTPREAAARGNCSKDRGKGNLEDAIAKMMLPTPCVRDYKGDRKLTNGKNMTAKGEEKGLSLEQSARILTGNAESTSKTSQLNPRFVLEMMGFPPDWTELPFQNGETSQLKREEMQ